MMSRALRNITRSHLENILGIADDEEFMALVWAVNALQSGRHESVGNFIAYPPQAITQDMGANLYVHPWRLETLVNEVLLAPKPRRIPGRPFRRLDCGKFDAIISAAAALQKLEDAEDKLFISQKNILKEIHRLAQRQFEWQRKALTMNRYFRSGYIYGGELTQQAFRDKHGIDMHDFTFSCLALASQFLTRPVVMRDIDLRVVGLDAQVVAGVWEIISASNAQGRAAAYSSRAGLGHVSYRKSVLRQYPCFSFGPMRQRIICPLPDLLVNRSTVGLYYDTLSRDGRVRNEISAAFHRYAIEFLEATLIGLRVENEFAYRLGKDRLNSPDILLCDNLARVVLEGKATKMSFEAKFSEDPLSEAKRGYDEILNGVVQIWRFASHQRQHSVSSTAFSPNICGVVLTLDSWLNMATEYQNELIEKARNVALRDVKGFQDCDVIPVSFCAIEDLEGTIMTGTTETFLSAVRAAGEQRFRGWELNGVHREVAQETTPPRPYPLRDRITEVFPWWTARPEQAADLGG